MFRSRPLIAFAAFSSLAAVVVAPAAQGKPRPDKPSLTALAELADIVYSVRVGGQPALTSAWELVNWRTRKNGFKGLSVVHRLTRRLVVAFAGTEGQAGDIVRDLGLAVRNDQELAARLQENFTRLVGQLLGNLGMRDFGEQLARQFLEKLDVGAGLRRVLRAASKFLPDFVARTTPQENDAEQFTREAQHTYARRPASARARIQEPILVGHSLGGFLAQIVSVRRRVPAVTFNAPGAFSERLPKRDAYRVDNHVRDKDIVGTFGPHVGGVYTYAHERLVLDNHRMPFFVQHLRAGKRFLRFRNMPR
jgi:hypothetical protein